MDEDGIELSHSQVREIVRIALKDKRFVKQPKLYTNCIRVFYSESDEERHHVDFPVYRKWIDDEGNVVRELASESGWLESDPTQVTKWFLNTIEERNSAHEGHGTQLRQLNQLLKRFCRSRTKWDLPNGMKLMMLIDECQPRYNKRIDIAFRHLLENIQTRLSANKTILNLAHPDKPALTRTAEDDNVVELLDRVCDAIEQLEELDDLDNDNCSSARKAWDWIFQSDEYFADKDKELALREKATAINDGTAKTSSLGIIGSVGTANPHHRFYGSP